MHDSAYKSSEYPSHDVRLSDSDSVRWDNGTADERRRLITSIADASLRGSDELDGCTVRVYHISGTLLAKTVLHAALFSG